MTGYVLVDGVAHSTRRVAVESPPLPLAGEARRAPARRVRVCPDFEEEEHPHPLVQVAESPLPQAGEGAVIAAVGDLLWVHLNGHTYQLEYRDAVTHLGEAAAQTGTMRAPMPGSVIAVSVAVGDAVAAGDAVMIIESMKLETVIRAPHDGVVEAVHFGIGARFDRDALLVSLVEAG